MRFGADNPFLDRCIWPNIQRRDNDIVIATYAKFGYLRMQMIIRELITASSGGYPGHLPWVELRHEKSSERIAAINQQRGPRILRTHLPADELYRHQGKYIFVGRDPRDLVFNLFRFLTIAPQDWYKAFDPSGNSLSRPHQNFMAFWDHWMGRDGEPIWPYFSHLNSWRQKRNERNVLLIHFQDFKANMEKELRRISEFLELRIKEADWPTLLQACDFERITQLCKREANQDDPFWNGGTAYGRKRMEPSEWTEYLTREHYKQLTHKVSETIGETGHDWLFKG